MTSDWKDDITDSGMILSARFNVGHPVNFGYVGTLTNAAVRVAVCSFSLIVDAGDCTCISCICTIICSYVLIVECCVYLIIELEFI